MLCKRILARVQTRNRAEMDLFEGAYWKLMMSTNIFKMVKLVLDKLVQWMCTDSLFGSGISAQRVTSAFCSICQLLFRAFALFASERFIRNVLP